MQQLQWAADVEQDTRSHKNPNHRCKLYGVHEVDGWSQILGVLYDTVKMNFCCLAHALTNMIKDLIYLLKGDKKGAYTANRKKHDAKCGKARTNKFTSTKAKPVPWRVPKATLDKIDTWLTDGTLPMWREAGQPNKKMFKHPSHLKIHDCMLMLGARGILFWFMFGVGFRSLIVRCLLIMRCLYTMLQVRILFGFASFPSLTIRS